MRSRRPQANAPSNPSSPHGAWLRRISATALLGFLIALFGSSPSQTSVHAQALGLEPVDPAQQDDSPLDPLLDSLTIPDAEAKPDHGIGPFPFPIHPYYPGRWRIIVWPWYWYHLHPCADPTGTMPGMPPPPGAPNPPTPVNPNTPAPTATLVPVATPTPGGAAAALTYRICPQVVNLIPAHIQTVAQAEPWRFNGYGELRNPNIPYHPIWNDYRKWLSLRDPGQPYSICNYPRWKSGCP